MDKRMDVPSARSRYFGEKKSMVPAENITTIFFIVRLVDVVCVSMCNGTYTSLCPLPIASMEG